MLYNTSLYEKRGTHINTLKTQKGDTYNKYNNYTCVSAHTYMGIGPTITNYTLTQHAIWIGTEQTKSTTHGHYMQCVYTMSTNYINVYMYVHVYDTLTQFMYTHMYTNMYIARKHLILKVTSLNY